MLNKLQHFISQYDMVQPGETVICAVSGGADSVALLWGMYLLKEKLQINVEAAHFNHHLRGEESMRDEAFVAKLCDQYDIKLHVGGAEVNRGKKGLEASARNARYAFLSQLKGKIATAHTADDNAETLLMHMLRGTGLKGLGGIIPKAEGLIRPMLSINREEVLTFLDEYHLTYVQDSSNDTDDFLRNRVRHNAMPFLKNENPRFSESMSDMALRLRQDEEELTRQAKQVMTNDVETLRRLTPAIRNRVMGMLLESFGVLEPSAEHIALLDSLIYSDNPSAKADFPGKIKIGRVYRSIEKIQESNGFSYELPIPGTVELAELDLRVVADFCSNGKDAFAFVPQGKVYVRSRCSGDEIRLPCGTKSLKKLFIDRKIPASHRNKIPVIADDNGVVGVYNIGMNNQRKVDGDCVVYLWFEKILER